LQEINGHSYAERVWEDAVGTGDVKGSWGRNGLGARKGKVCTSRGSSETGCGWNTLVRLLGKRDEYLTFYHVSALKDSRYRRYG